MKLEASINGEISSIFINLRLQSTISISPLDSFCLFVSKRTSRTEAFIKAMKRKLSNLLWRLFIMENTQKPSFILEQLHLSRSSCSEEKHFLVCPHRIFFPPRMMISSIKVLSPLHRETSKNRGAEEKIVFFCRKTFSAGVRRWNLPYFCFYSTKTIQKCSQSQRERQTFCIHA